MSVEQLETKRKEAWKEYKRVREYIRPLYFTSTHSLPVGELSHKKILNNSGKIAFGKFCAADLEWKRALYGKNKEA